MIKRLRQAPMAIVWRNSIPPLSPQYILRQVRRAATVVDAAKSSFFILSIRGIRFVRFAVQAANLLT
ncbi:MAG: hypothetical protein V1857_02120 [archaeon]